MAGSRSIRAQAGNIRMATPPGLTPAQTTAFQRISRTFRNTATSLGTSKGRKIGSLAGVPARQENTRRPPPQSPRWVSFQGGGGTLRGVFKMPAGVPDQGSLQFEIQLASNSTFTSNLTSFDQVGRSWMVFMPDVTRFARVRARYFDSMWGGWRASGAPTSVSSGVLALTAVVAGTPTGAGTTTQPAPPPPPPDPVDSPTEDAGVGGPHGNLPGL